MLIPEAYIPTATGHPATGRGSTDRVLTYLLEGLVSGTIHQGEWVNAKKLAILLDVTIVPVREALHYLAGVGLIELLPLRGARIRSLSVPEILSRFEIFCSLGSIGLKHAARVVSDSKSNTSKIAEATEQITAAFNRVPHPSFIMRMLNFHQVLHEIAGLKVLDDSIRQLQVVLWCISLPEVISFDTYGRSFVRNYQRISDNVLWGNGPSAVAAFQHHSDWACTIIAGERPDPDAAYVPVTAIN